MVGRMAVDHRQGATGLDPPDEEQVVQLWVEHVHQQPEAAVLTMRKHLHRGVQQIRSAERR